jgi:phosphopantothenoylcysteine decarboxylase/phosphopantothenate--cysteine ligase
MDICGLISEHQAVLLEEWHEYFSSSKKAHRRASERQKTPREVSQDKIVSQIFKCIVTAGPTYEELDEVRRLTNFSTGALGTELANFLTERGHEVELLRGHGATCRVEPKAHRVQAFTTTADLRRRLQDLAASGAGAVFHAAAVSDFGIGKIWQRAADGVLTEIRSPKISTRGGSILAELTPTPKILAGLRAWFPAAFLAGWKYELESDRAQAIARASAQLAENRTDACVLNGRAYGEGFGLVTPPGQCRHLADRKILFDALEGLLRGSKGLENCS